MSPGSVHYILFQAAHRVANTGVSILMFLGRWPSVAEHDYEAIARRGFSARLRKINGTARLIEEP